MKNIQKITLALLTMAGVSTLSAALEVNFADGAEQAGNITGAAKFSGSGSMILSGVVSGASELALGNVKIAAANKFGGAVTMNGGDLQATAAMTVPSLIMSAAGTLTADAAVDVSNSGSGALTLAGAGEATLVVMSSTGGITAAAQKVNLNASSVLDGTAPYNLAALDIDADAAAAGNFATVIASGIVTANASVAAGSFTALTIASATGKLDIGNNTFSQAVTVS